METLKDKLDQFDGQPEQAWSDRKSISVGERGQKYIAQFSVEHASAVYAIDGGIIKDCDTSISHAIKQVEATLINPLFKDAAVVERQARIIGRKIPSNTGNSITEVAKKRFISKYRCRLEFKSGPATERLKI